MDKDILFINCSLINLGIIQCSVAMVNFTFSFRTIILRIVANLMTLTLEHDPRFRRVPINNFQMLCHDHRCDKQENIFKEKIIGMYVNLKSDRINYFLKRTFEISAIYILLTNN